MRDARAGDTLEVSCGTTRPPTASTPSIIFARSIAPWGGENDARPQNMFFTLAAALQPNLKQLGCFPKPPLLKGMALASTGITQHTSSSSIRKLRKAIHAMTYPMRLARKRVQTVAARRISGTRLHYTCLSPTAKVEAEQGSAPLARQTAIMKQTVPRPTVASLANHRRPCHSDSAGEGIERNGRPSG
jgi:hypothetical protein